jgi:hypothetical protein
MEYPRGYSPSRAAPAVERQGRCRPACPRALRPARCPKNLHLQMTPPPVDPDALRAVLWACKAMRAMLRLSMTEEQREEAMTELAVCHDVLAGVLVNHPELVPDDDIGPPVGREVMGAVVAAACMDGFP